MQRPHSKQTIDVGKDKVRLFHPGSHRSRFFRGHLFTKCPNVKVKTVPLKGEVILSAEDLDSLRHAVDVVQEISGMTLFELAFPEDFAAELRRNGFWRMNKLRNKHNLWFFFLGDDHTLSILGAKENVAGVILDLPVVAERFNKRRASQQNHAKEAYDEGGGEEEKKRVQLMIRLDVRHVEPIASTLPTIRERFGVEVELFGEGLLSIRGAAKDVRRAEQHIMSKSPQRSKAQKAKGGKGNVTQQRREVKEASPSHVSNVPSSSKVTIWWYWKDEHDGWVRYTTDIEVLLETSYLQVATSKTKATLYTFATDSYVYEVKLKDGLLTQVNLTTLRERSVKRADGQEKANQMSLRTSKAIPWYWRMPHPEGNEAKMFDLAQTDQLYRRVQRKFHKQICNSEFKIISIKFIQCPRRWQSYVEQRQQYIDFGGRTDIQYERCLWHGTAYENIHKIAKQGFLRQFGSRQAHGDGVYFAVNSSYSASSAYSVPDNSGNQHMLLCRVLVGEHGQGRAGVKVPPNKPHKNEECESMVDNVHRPSMFIICRDDYAYPEYLVTFRRKASSTRASPYSSAARAAPSASISAHSSHAPTSAPTPPSSTAYARHSSHPQTTSTTTPTSPPPKQESGGCMLM